MAHTARTHRSKTVETNENGEQSGGTERGARSAAPTVEATDQHGQCPECSSAVRSTETETVCTSCGLVVAEDMLDRGPEWRSFSDEETNRSRVGPSRTLTRHDTARSTTFSLHSDGYGNTLSSKKKAKFSRFRKWEKQAAMSGDGESKMYAFGEIRRLASVLSLPDVVREQAAKYFREAHAADLVQSRDLDSFAGASVYAAIREYEVPRLLAEVVAESRTDATNLRGDYSRMNRELGLPLSPPTPLTFVHRIADAVSISDIAAKRARDVLKRIESQGNHTGRNPAGIAAGAIAYVTDDVTYTDLGTVADLTGRTVSKATDDIDEWGPYAHESVGGSTTTPTAVEDADTCETASTDTGDVQREPATASEPTASESDPTTTPQPEHQPDSPTEQTVSASSHQVGTTRPNPCGRGELGRNHRCPGESVPVTAPVPPPRRHRDDPAAV